MTTQPLFLRRARSGKSTRPSGATGNNSTFLILLFLQFDSGCSSILLFLQLAEFALMYFSNNKGQTWPKGDLCFFIHNFKERREPQDPILVSIKKKIDKAPHTRKWNEIHLTKEMEIEYVETQSKYKHLQIKYEQLQYEYKALESKLKYSI